MPEKITEPPKYDSPEVSADGRLTVQIYAPNALVVTLEGEWDNWAKHPMVREEAGLWYVTTAPLPPDIYEYSLVVDGHKTLDTKNPLYRRPTVSHVVIPGPAAAYFEPQPGPRGALHVHWYHSKAVGTMRRLRVYTPPGYEAAQEMHFPVLYLLHGAGDTDEDWTGIGRANVILDNLINHGQTAPMIVVMPQGHISVPGRTLDRAEAFAAFENDLTGEVVPLIERMYRTIAIRERRAMAGLSMGGGQTVVVGMKHPKLFGAYGVFSAGVWAGAEASYEAAITALKGSPAPVWIGIGKDDFLFERCQALLALLRGADIPFTYEETPGAHSWSVWRNYLHRFTPLLFRP